MKKRHPIQTAGFGMGVERFLMWVLKCDDIRNLQVCLRFNGIDTTPKFDNNYINHKGTVDLESKRLRLRKIRVDDAEAMFKNWAGDDEVTKYLTWPTHSDVSVTRNVISSWVESYKNDDYYLWAIEDKETNELIGTISVVDKDDDKKQFELGMCLCKRYWGQRIALEAGLTVAEYLKSLGYKYLKATTEVGNDKCLKAINRENFEYNGIEKDGSKKLDGTTSDVYVYKKVL